MGRQDLGSGRVSTAPPPPPGFSLDPPKQAAPQAKPTRPRGNKPARDLSLETIGRVVDGDTFKLGTGDSVRLWGVDAPELKQQGWNRSGTAVPIGEQSRDALSEYLNSGRSIVGPQVMESWGRPVAPATVDGNDLANLLIRSGNGYAAPQYLAADPDRRFKYTQSERLARQNLLGMHDTFHQSPKEHRDNPKYVIPRETVPLWFDTPTPNAGMRPEVEQEYLAMLNDYSVSPQAVANYVKDNGGFVVDPDEVEAKRERAKKSGQTIGFDYTEQPEVLTDSGDGALGAGTRGFFSGYLANGLDEAGTFPDMFGGTAGRENIWNSDRRWADIWLNNQKQNHAILGYDDMAHPYATMGGQVAGGHAGMRFPLVPVCAQPRV